MTKNRVRSFITAACTISGILGILDFYLNWIRQMKFIDFIGTHIISIIGLIGILTLFFLWSYWKISDYINYQKEEINKQKRFNSKLVEVINNHADCLNIKTTIRVKNVYGNSAFVEKIENIIPLKLDLNESDRDNQ